MSVCCMHQHENMPGSLWCKKCESLIAGVRFDDYTVTSYLGQGSFGAIYLAQQHSLNNRTVVIKLSQEAWSREGVAAFRQEAAILASLSHPYILPIHAYGLLHLLQGHSSNYAPYVVLPYAEQGSLEDILASEHTNTLPLKRVLTIVEEIAEALDYAHSKGVLHRDIKPANMLLMGAHVVLSDFGVAALIDVDTSHVQTSLAGSPAFMAPEVWRFCPGRYSDQYALAVTCFRLLTGTYPWHNPEGRVSQWTYLHSFVPPQALHTYRPELPADLDRVLQRALAKDPHDRYPSVSAFASDLRAAANNIEVCLIPLPLNFPPPLQFQAIAQEQAMTKAADAQTAPISPSVIPASSQAMQAPVAVDQMAHTDTIMAGESWFPPEQPEDKQQKYLDVQTEVLTKRSNHWVPQAFILNLLVCLLFLAQAAYMRESTTSLLQLFLALSPSLVVGPLLALGFRRLPHPTLAWSILWGLLFGIGNTLLSALFSSAGTALVLTFLQWGHAWMHSGDGLRIFFEELRALQTTVLLLTIVGLWVTVIGGICISVFHRALPKR